MTYADMLSACIDFQSEVRFSRYNYDTDELILLTEEDARHKEIKYMYPIDATALMIEIDSEDD